MKGARRVRRAVRGDGAAVTPPPRPGPTRLQKHLSEIYGASVSKETVSRITDKVVAEMQEWSSRPLDEVYVAIFIDAIVVKIRALAQSS